MRKQLIVALSLANLCFFHAWREVLSPRAFNYFYYWKHYPGYKILGALLVNVLLLTLLFLVGAWLTRNSNRHVQRFARFGFLLVFLLALNRIRSQFDSLSLRQLRVGIGKAGAFGVCLGLFAIALFVFLRFGVARIVAAVTLGLLILSPFGLVGLVEATWLTSRYGAAFRIEPATAAAGELKVVASNRARVVWLIFDELDQRLVFSERPPGLKLPEFDRLRNESLLATNAFPPASHTSQSIPALLTGKLISGVKPAGPGELLLTLPEQQEPAGWSSQPDIFSRARAAGFNTSLIGWYHPYCRIIGDRLSSCHWEAASQITDARRLSVARNLLRQDVELLYSLPFTARLRNWFLQTHLEEYKSAHLADYRALIEQAKIGAGSQQPGLTLIHLPVPHPPSVYNRVKGDFDVASESSYLDSLALADRALGELRLTMEQAGTWEDAVLIVSADHWFRSDYWRERRFWSREDESVSTQTVNHRVPFLVKLGRNKTPLTYEAPFNTVLTHDLILDVLSEKVVDAKQVSGWLDAHRTIGESPYQDYEDAE